jgi:hypothetical protein
VTNKANLEKMDDIHIESIKEFMQVPHQIFKEHLYNDKSNRPQQLLSQPIDEDDDEYNYIESPAMPRQNLNQ